MIHIKVYEQLSTDISQVTERRIEAPEEIIALSRNRPVISEILPASDSFEAGDRRGTLIVNADNADVTTGLIDLYRFVFC